jgi:SET domain-containing protein
MHAVRERRPLRPIASDYRRRPLPDVIEFIEDIIRRYEADLDNGRIHKDRASFPLWNFRSALLELRDKQQQQTTNHKP